MFGKEPKNTSRYYWTEHVKFKMKFYGLSEQRVLGIIRNPKRKEVGVVERTVAVMKPVSQKIENGKAVWKQEIWAMYQLCQNGVNHKSEMLNTKQTPKRNAKYKIISAWKYPGVSPKKNPIPEEIIDEISRMV